MIDFKFNDETTTKQTVLYVINGKEYQYEHLLLYIGEYLVNKDDIELAEKWNHLDRTNTQEVLNFAENIGISISGRTVLTYKEQPIYQHFKKWIDLANSYEKGRY